MIIDLTLPIDINNPVYEWAKNSDNPHVNMGHFGTHIDTYKKSVIPLEYFESNGKIFNVTDRLLADRPEISLADHEIELINNDDFVLFYTGHIEKYGYGTKEYFANHPYLSMELMEQLVSRSIRFIGIDCPGIRQHAEHEQADRYFEKNNIYIIENLTNLNSIIEPMKIYTMWLDDVIRTGLPCRVLAKIN